MPAAPDSESTEEFASRATANAPTSETSRHDLVAQARETRVVVVGAGLSGAVAALECAKVGLQVTLIGSAPQVAALAVDLDGVAVMADADYARPAGATPSVVDVLLDDLGMSDASAPLASPSDASPWTVGIAGRAPLPGASLLGIPANTWDPAVRRIIGWAGTWRAYLDRVRPPLTIGRERNLGALVGARMGDRVRERLVAPVTRGRWNLEPHEVDVDVAAPGLNAALTRTGSLGGAVAEALDAPSPEAWTVTRDWSPAFADRLAELGVEVRTGVRVTGLTRSAAHAWTVAVASVDDADADAATAGSVAADAVIIATGEADARALLPSTVTLPDVELAAPVDVVLMRARIDAPSASVVFPQAGDVRRVDDVTDLGATPSVDGERIVRVELRVPTGHHDAATGDAAAVIERAREEATTALDVTLAADAVVAAVRQPVAGRLPGVRRGAAESRAEVRDAVATASHLALTGAWLTDGRIGDTIADAVEEAARVRRELLWGDDAEA